MRTSSNFPFRGFTTRTMDPNGKFGWAAVSASQSYFSPLAVFLPLKPGPYQLELPTQVFIGFTGELRLATRGASMTGTMRNIRSTHRKAAQKTNSGRLIVCSLCYSYPEKCSKE